MTKLFLLFTSLFLLLSHPSTAQPKAIDITHSVLDITFDWSKKSAHGTATISLTLLAATDEIHLRADALTITRVTASGKELGYTIDPPTHNLSIALGKKFNANEKLELIVAYETGYHNETDPNLLGGSFGKGIRFIQPTPVSPVKRQQAWSQGEAENSSYWFPGSHDANDVRTTEFIGTVPGNLAVISNGELIGTRTNPDHTKTFHYKNAVPYAGYLTSFVAGEYTDYVQRHNGVSLHTYCYPDELVAAKATVVRLPAMVKFLEEKTGLAYPFKSYAQVMVQEYPFPGLTGQHMVTTISDNMIDDKGTHDDFLYLWDGVEFNALASQWFGSVMAPANWRDAWLTKGFAQYYEGLFTDAANGHGEYLLWYHPFETGSVVGDWTNGNRHPLVPVQVEDPEAFVNDSYAKFRGALVLRMLNKELGEVQFAKVVQHFVRTNAYKPVSTRDLQKSIKAITGSDLQWFFDQWVYKTGHPVFEVSKTYDSRNGVFQIRMLQVQEFDSSTTPPSPRYFQGKMEIALDNKIETVVLKAQKENLFTFKRTQPPLLCNVDVENTWRKEITFEKSTDEYLYQLQNDADVSARQSAMIALVASAKRETATPAERASLEKALKSVIKSQVYWRLRLNALGQLRTLMLTPYSDETRKFLLDVIRTERSWIKASAVGMLGTTSDANYVQVYIDCFKDSSDRVVAAAALALGKTKSPLAFDALIKLKDRPSWKSQSLMHTLSGLAQLGDPRGVEVAVAALSDIQSPRWFLANGWDYPFIAAQTAYTLGDVSKAHDVVMVRFQTAVAGNDISDIFHHLLLIATMADKRGQQAFDLLKEKYKGNQELVAAVAAYEASYTEKLKK